jgi:inosine-uridine nucleoside N-ribohydrolase
VVMGAQRELHIVVLAPLTALAAALRADKDGVLAGVGGVFVQGVAAVDAHTGTLFPSADATNMREDMPAANVTPSS